MCADRSWQLVCALTQIGKSGTLAVAPRPPATISSPSAAWLLSTSPRSANGSVTIYESRPTDVIALGDGAWPGVTLGAQAHEEEDHAETINSFISALTGPSYRGGNPYWPVLVVGDFNILIDRPWPRNTTQVARADLMAAALGAGVGLQPTHTLSLSSATPLPNRDPCTGPQAVGAFSDHCGLLVRFVGN